MTHSAHRISNTGLAVLLPYHAASGVLGCGFDWRNAALAGLGVVLCANLPDRLEFSILPHRRITHVLLYPVAVLAALWHWDGLETHAGWFAAGCALGYAAHLACDLLDCGGVLVTPVGPKVGLGLYRTSGWFVFVGVILWLALCGLLFCLTELPYYR